MQELGAARVMPPGLDSCLAKSRLPMRWASNQRLSAWQTVPSSNRTKASYRHGLAQSWHTRTSSPHCPPWLRVPAAAA